MTKGYQTTAYSISCISQQAFKEGKAFGKCLSYQKTIVGQAHSKEQASKIWCRTKH